MATIAIDIDEAEWSGLAETPEEFARELRLAAAIEWCRQGRISQGRGAEIAGLNRWDFMQALSRARVEVLPIAPGDLDAGA